MSEKHKEALPRSATQDRLSKKLGRPSLKVDYKDELGEFRKQKFNRSH